MRRAVLLVACGCTAANPDYQRPPPQFADLSVADTARPPDGASPDLATRGDLSTVIPSLDLRAPAPDLALPPLVELAENVAATWDVGESESDTPQPCNPVKRGRVALAPDPARAVAGLEAARVTYGPDGSNYFQALTPRARNAAWDLRARGGVAVSVDAAQPMSYGGWDPAGPTVVLCGPSGHRRLEPTQNLLPRAGGMYVHLMVPLAGGPGWRSVESGQFSLARVDWIEFHADPRRNNGNGSVTLWLDAVRFY